MTEKIKLIIDTDIGDDIDDAFAIALLLASPETEILGVTTVYRNAYLRAKIAKHLIRLYGKDIPVYAGEDVPINDEMVKFDFETIEADGKPRIGHYSDEMADAPIEENGGVDYILEEIGRHPHEITLLSLSPMTNLARAFAKSPDTFRKLRCIHIMGGDPFYPVREWNIRCDEEAAEKVFSSGVSIKLIGCNVTRICALSEENVRRINAFESAGGRCLAKMMNKWIENNPAKCYPVMHDGLAAACLFADYCDFVEIPVQFDAVNMRGRMTVAGDRTVQATRILAATCVDKAGFLAFLMERLETLETSIPFDRIRK